MKLVNKIKLNAFNDMYSNYLDYHIIIIIIIKEHL